MLIANISHCLHSLRSVNVTIHRLEVRRKEQFDKSNLHHVHLLEQLWTNMRPNVRRAGGLVTAEWGEVGFQGSDPSTDFRGMGMLGLEQLVFLSQQRGGQDALALLAEADHPRRYFPYAATGMSMTKFVLELLAETRLHRVVLARLERDCMSDLSGSGSEGPSSDSHTISACCDSVHEVYCQLYVDFGRLWVLRDPRDIMSFSAIFAELQATYRARYSPI